MKSDHPTQGTFSLLHLPTDLQVNLLTYLRAFDLANVQQTCTYYANPSLVHAIVLHTAERVYPATLTLGFQDQPVSYTPNCPARSTADLMNINTPGFALYTYEHLRNMELLVIARVLNSPEPSTGYIVSKSWCKTALRWLEAHQEQQQQQQSLVKAKFNKNVTSNNSKKKASKKQQRLRNRKYSDTSLSPPWPNVNSDLLCSHACLQRCSSSKSARARRRIIDKQAWKILKRLYPDSTQLESAVGECIQCTLEAETAKRTEQDRLEQLTIARKQPLEDVNIRRFYNRRNGVPQQALITPSTTTTISSNNSTNGLYSNIYNKSMNRCPLVPGKYYILPRSWCHYWRKYIKTGVDDSGQACSPPDAAVLLCDAHRLLSLPPHLEFYIYGDSEQLLASIENIERQHYMDYIYNNNYIQINNTDSATSPDNNAVAVADPSVLQAMRAAGLSESEVREQLSVMRVMEQSQYHYHGDHASSNDIRHNDNSNIHTIHDVGIASGSANLTQPNQQQRQELLQHQQAMSIADRNECLDRENKCVVEILTEDEYLALEQCWPGLSYQIGFTVKGNENKATNSEIENDSYHCHKNSGVIQFSTPVCRKCDATGRNCALSIKNRARGWVKRSAVKSGAPAGLEF